MKYIVWVIDDELSFRQSFNRCFDEYDAKKQVHRTKNNNGDDIEVKIYPALGDGSHIVEESRRYPVNEIPNLILLDLKLSTDNDGITDPFLLGGLRVILDGLSKISTFNKTAFLLFTQMKLSSVQKTKIDKAYRLNNRLLDVFGKQEFGFNVVDKNCEALQTIINIWTEKS